MTLDGTEDLNDLEDGFGGVYYTFDATWSHRDGRAGISIKWKLAGRINSLENKRRMWRLFSRTKVVVSFSSFFFNIFSSSSPPFQ